MARFSFRTTTATVANLSMIDGIETRGIRLRWNSLHEVVLDLHVPVDLVQGALHVAVLRPPAGIGLVGLLVDRLEPPFVVRGHDYPGHVTEAPEHVLDVPHQDRPAGRHFTQP